MGFAETTAGESIDPSNRKVVQTTINGSSSSQNVLRLAMLACEDGHPYGPATNTASMFLDLVSRALGQCTSDPWTISIAIYHVKKRDFPQDWNVYQGYLIPGSLSSAYDPDAWIDKLSRVIQQELVENSRPTFGICFGHQIYAHSFQTGRAVKCPAGPQAGCRTLHLTDEGRRLLSITGNDSSLDLYYTHGDMVEALPECAVSLGGNDRVPILGAAYSSSKKNGYSSSKKNGDRPIIAITFQAHPEYVSRESKTFQQVLDKMEQRGHIGAEERRKEEEDAWERYNVVEQCSVQLMKQAGQQLGWFPNSSSEN